MKGHGSSLASSRNCSLATLSGSNTASAFPGVPGWAVTAAWSRSRVKVAALLLGLAIGSQSQNSAATFTRRGLDQRLLLSSSAGYHDRKFELLSGTWLSPSYVQISLPLPLPTEICARTNSRRRSSHPRSSASTQQEPAARRKSKVEFEKQIGKFGDDSGLISRKIWPS